MGEFQGGEWKRLFQEYALSEGTEREQPQGLPSIPRICQFLSSVGDSH